MHNGDQDGAIAERNRPARRSSEENVGQSRTAQANGQMMPAGARAPRRSESKRPWASRRAAGPSWADTVEPF